VDVSTASKLLDPSETMPLIPSTVTGRVCAQNDCGKVAFANANRAQATLMMTKFEINDVPQASRPGK
jgi:hypothetical protein